MCDAIVNQMVKHLPQLLDRTFGALADPTRRKILAELAHGDRCVTDLAKPHRMSLPAVSKHLRVLERAGLVRRHRCGRGAFAEAGGEADEGGPGVDGELPALLGAEFRPS